MARKIRVGILGCAAIAKRSLAPAFLKHDDFDLVAVASRVPEKAEAFIAAIKPRCALRCCTYDELVMAKDIDMVYCPLPTGLHYEWVKRCLLSGKHVQCEKSLASSFQEVADLVACARENHRLLLESFQFRFHPQNCYVKELLDNGKIGDLRQCLIRFGVPPFPDGEDNIRYKRELGGGALLDNGAYAIKCAAYLFGHDIEVLAALSGSGAGPSNAVDVVGSMMLRVKTPSCSQAFSVQAAYGFDHFYKNGYMIWGNRGTIETIRAFTARDDFAAPVAVETCEGREEHVFKADHFAALLDYERDLIRSGDFEVEYEENLLQARLMESVRHKIEERELG